MDPARIDDQGRPEPPVAAGEVGAVIGFLEYQRATLRWKCSGLDTVGLRTTTASSSMTLGGLLKHLAFVEHHWFHRAFEDAPALEPWASVDWDADRDWDWNSALTEPPEVLFDLWESAVERSRAVVERALAGDGLDARARQDCFDGDPPNLRWIVLHMVEEYARHNGHADLLRETVDGATGE